MTESTFKEKLNYLISNIYIPKYFGNWNNYGYSFDFVTENKDLLSKVFPGATTECGISKVVIIIPDCKYVIKIPYNGEFFGSPTREDNYILFKDKEEKIHYFYSFNSASYLLNTKNEWNYCQDEIDLYHLAMDNNVESFFAEEHLYGFTKNNYPIYIQEKVMIFDEYYEYYDYYSDSSCDQSSALKEYTLIAHYLYNVGLYASSQWVIDAISYYGIQKFKELIDFLSRTGIDDLHDQNVGYTIDNTPIIIDWGGYWE